MSFDFSLQPLLRVRRSYEQRERMNLALVAQELAKRSKELEDLDTLISERSRNSRSALSQGLPSGEHRIAEGEIEALKQMRSDLLARIEEIEAHRQAQLNRMVLARRNTRILESLRDKRFEAWRIVEDRREQQRQDDLFGSRRDRTPPLE